MTAAAEASAIESRVGHYYQADDTYVVGREKVREYARAVQNYHPAHWDVVAAAELGYSGLVAPLTFTSTRPWPAIAACSNRWSSVTTPTYRPKRSSSSTARSWPATNCTSTSN